MSARKRDTRKHVYHVAYAHTRGWGRTETTMLGPIDESEALTEIEALVIADNVAKGTPVSWVCVISFNLLRIED